MCVFFNLFSIYAFLQLLRVLCRSFFPMVCIMSLLQAVCHHVRSFFVASSLVSCFLLVLLSLFMSFLLPFFLSLIPSVGHVVIPTYYRHCCGDDFFTCYVTACFAFSKSSIRLDERWRRNLSVWQRLLVKLASVKFRLWLLLRYGAKAY